MPPQGRPLRGQGPAWGFLCHPGGLCRGPWDFCGRRAGLVAQETAGPVGVHRWGIRVQLQKARFAKPGVLGASAPVVWPPRGPKPLEHSPCHPGGLPWRRVAPRRWPVGGCTGACDSGCWLGCRLGQVGFGWLAQGAWQGATGVHWPALVGKCKPPRWHQTPGIFLGPSFKLPPIVAETAAQNDKTVWHKTGHFQLQVGALWPRKPFFF